MHSELIALADNGRLYSWSWGKKDKPSNMPHHVNDQFFNNGLIFFYNKTNFLF